MACGRCHVPECQGGTPELLERVRSGAVGFRNGGGDGDHGIEDGRRRLAAQASRRRGRSVNRLGFGGRIASLHFGHPIGQCVLVGPGQVRQSLAQGPGVDLVVQRDHAQIADADLARLLQQLLALGRIDGGQRLL